MSCRNGGTVSAIGAYGGFVDTFPMGAVVNRSLTSHTMPLDEAPQGYEMFRAKQDDCTRIVLKP